MKLILVAPNPLLYHAFQEHFHYLPNVEIINNYFEAVLEYDCLVRVQLILLGLWMVAWMLRSLDTLVIL